MLISFEEIINKVKEPIRGIIHIGAHKGEESKVYNKHQINNVIWIEGNPTLIDQLTKNVGAYPNHHVYNYMIDYKERIVDFHITNNSQSSSILELGSHRKFHPDIIVEDIIKLKTKRIDEFIMENEVDIQEYNFVNLDIQGNELSALKSFGKYLVNIDYIYSEVNITKVYKKCALLHEIDFYLARKGFERISIKLTNWGWGDAFYVKKKQRSTAFLNNILSAYSLEMQKLFKEAKEQFYRILKNLR